MKNQDTSFQILQLAEAVFVALHLFYEIYYTDWYNPILQKYDNFHRYTFATGDPVLANGVWIKDAACLLWIGIAALSLALILFHARRHRAYAK